jgi:hypothetical protein
VRFQRFLFTESLVYSLFQLQQRISDAHSNVRNLSCREAKLQYIRNWEALPEHALHYFIVKFRRSKFQIQLMQLKYFIALSMQERENQTRTDCGGTQPYYEGEQRQWGVDEDLALLGHEEMACQLGDQVR